MVRAKVVCIFRSLLRTFCDVRGFPQAEFGRKQKVVGSKAEHWSTPQLGAIARSARCTARAARGEHVRRALPARARARGWRRGTRFLFSFFMCPPIGPTTNRQSDKQQTADRTTSLSTSLTDSPPVCLSVCGCPGALSDPSFPFPTASSRRRFI